MGKEQIPWTVLMIPLGIWAVVGWYHAIRFCIAAGRPEGMDEWRTCITLLLLSGLAGVFMPDIIYHARMEVWESENK